jgi:hypothetical protein
MFKTLNELVGLVDSPVVVEFTRPTSSETIKTDGMLLRAGPQGIVFESKGKTEIIPLVAIIDLYPFTAPRKVVRRKVQQLLQRRARQHLLDRHGIPWDLIKFTTEATAFVMHQKIDHTNLGHQHRAPGDTRPDEEEELT